MEDLLSELPSPPTSVASPIIFSHEDSIGPIEAPCSYGHASAAYHAILEIFRVRLYTVWPTVDIPALAEKLTSDADDWQSHALAAALCSAVVAQLRLVPRSEPEIGFPACAFAAESQRLRKQHEYREYGTLDSLLTSFFLHIYFSNIQKLSTASYLLRETVTTAHILRLDEPESYEMIPHQDYQHSLRIFWILFVTERTFCAQNDLVPILQPISELPEQDLDSASMSGFADLARLFIYLEAKFFRSHRPSGLATGSQEDKVKVLGIQKQLELDTKTTGVSETQLVDLNMTRHWIRSIIWRYSFTHFTRSSQSTAAAFSATYPAQIARESLLLLCSSSNPAIRAHGYGMELKILRLAGSLLDVLVCFPGLRYSSAISGWQDCLLVLGKILQDVGGSSSPFATLLRHRIMESDLTNTIIRELPTSEPVIADEETLEFPDTNEMEAVYRLV